MRMARFKESFIAKSIKTLFYILKRYTHIYSSLYYKRIREKYAKKGKKGWKMGKFAVWGPLLQRGRSLRELKFFLATFFDAIPSTMERWHFQLVPDTSVSPIGRTGTPRSMGSKTCFLGSGRVRGSGRPEPENSKKSGTRGRKIV